MATKFQKRFEEQLIILSEEYTKEKDVQKSFLLYSSLEAIIRAYYLCFGKHHKLEKTTANIHKIYRKIFLSKIDSLSKAFLINFLENKKFHSEFAEGIISNLKESSIAIEDNPSKISKYSKEELKKILQYYLESEYQKGNAIYQELLKDQRIGSCQYLNKTSLAGLTTYDFYNNIGLVALPSSDNTLNYIKTIIHELGHIEDNQFSDNMQKNFTSTITSIFTEVNSTYRELEFIEHLNKGKYQEESQAIMNETIKEIFFDMSNIYIYNELIADSKMNDPEMLNSITLSLIYGYGRILSLYFLEFPDEYQWFKNNKIKAGLFNKKIFKDLNITSDKVNKVLAKTIKNNSTLGKKGV